MLIQLEGALADVDPLLFPDDGSIGQTTITATTNQQFRDVHLVSPSDRETKEGGTKTRYAMLALGVLCMTSLRSNELAFNLTVICMTSNATSDVLIFVLL
jgi:hypothetical protein